MIDSADGSKNQETTNLDFLFKVTDSQKLIYPGIYKFSDVKQISKDL